MGSLEFVSGLGGLCKVFRTPCIRSCSVRILDIFGTDVGQFSSNNGTLTLTVEGVFDFLVPAFRANAPRGRNIRVTWNEESRKFP